MMSEEQSSKQDDQRLEENISRVLPNAQLPKLDVKAAEQMLAELKTKQQELFPTEGKIMASSVMTHTETVREFHAWESKYTVILLALIMGPMLVGALLYWALQGDSANPTNDKGVVIQDETPEDKEEDNQPKIVQELGKFLEGELTRRDMADGTVLIANKSANYSIDGPREVTLKSGDLFLIVAKSKTPLVVHTEQGEVRATGTRFSVSANKAHKTTSAAVAQGTVELESDEGEIELTAGQQGALKDSEKPTRQPAPRLSHVVSWAKEALAQDELLVEKKKENGLVAVDPSGQESKLSLRKYHVNVYIEDGIARTTIDQTFFNHNPWNNEGTFYFPLPPNASVSRLAMYVAGNLNEGGMVSRQRGQQIYNDILHQQRDPALLEMMEGNMFKMRIFPLEGRQEKRIFLSYTQKLDELYNNMRYWFPMDHTHSVAGEVSISVRIKDGAKNFDPQSSTHDMNAKTDGDDLLLNYSQEKIKPDQDLLLNLIPTKKPESTRVSVCEKDGKKFLFARISPELDEHQDEKQVAPKRARQWIVLNDVSASRSEIEAKAQRYVISRLIEEADDDDSVLLIDLDTRANKVTFDPVSVRSKTAKIVQAHHRPNYVGIGACNIEAGIAAVNKAIDDGDLTNPHFVYLGDGVATDGERKVSELTAKLRRDVPFIGIGVGKSVDALFMQTAADKTGGMFATINPDEDIDWRVFDLVAALNTSRMNKVEVLLFDENDKPVNAIAYPSSRGLSDGETLTVVARLDGELPTELVFRGEVNGRTVAISADLSKAKQDAEFIPRLWAKRHIDELLKSDMPRKEEIEQLSKEYYVVTPYTSLIVLEDDAMYAEYKVERGRKDHWALYDAPKKIDVVREELPSNRWDWYGYRPVDSEDEKVDVKSQPKTVQEIVDNMQLRVNAPFYYQNPTGPGSSRDGLYKLAESMLGNEDETGNDDEKKLREALRVRTNRLLSVWYLLSAGATDVLRDTGSSNDSVNPETDITASGGVAIKSLGLPGQQIAGARYGKPKLLSGLMRRSEFGFIPAPIKLPKQSARFDHMLLPAISQQLEGEQRSLQFAEHWYDSGITPLPVYMSFQNAMQTRWSRIHRDVENYNRQNGSWQWQRANTTWGVRSNNGIDFNGNTNFALNNDLSKLFADFDSDGALPQLMNDKWINNRDFILSDREIPQPIWLSGGEGFERASNGFVPALFNYANGSDYFVGYDEADYQNISLPYYPLKHWSFPASHENSYKYSFGIQRNNQMLGTISGHGASTDAFFEQLGESKMLMMTPRIIIPEFEEEPLGSRRFRSRGLYRQIRPLMTFTSLSQSQTTQPPMVSAIAADRLKRRRDELAGLELDEAGKLELKLVDAALENVEAAAARVESSEPFWNGDLGWRPQIKQFQPPQIQAWSGYVWAFDLTRYADGLYTSEADILNEVTNEYGAATPLGNVSDEAKKAIDSARDKIAPVRVGLGREAESGERKEEGNDSGVELLVASGDRFALTSRNEMYLKERLICDGESIWQVYDELGIAARREATEQRMSSLRAMVPHLLPPVEVLSMFHHVELIDEDEESFTLKLTMAEKEVTDEREQKETEKNEEGGEDAKDEKDEEQSEVVLIIRVDKTGRILEKSLEIDSERVLQVVFDCESKSDHVSIKWLAVESASEQNNSEDAKPLKEIGSTEYVARSSMLHVSSFRADPENLVVIDMPLRRPAFYNEQITAMRTRTKLKGAETAEKLSEEDQREWLRLHRHYSLSSIQELNWRRWGQECHPAKASMINVAYTRFRANQPLLPGDMTLLGSSGCYDIQSILHDNLEREKLDKAIENLTRKTKDNLLAKFFQNSRNTGWQLDDKAFDEETGLVGHLAAFLKANNWSDREPLYDGFVERFGDSPLLLALTNQHASKRLVDRVEPWLKMNDSPRWKGMAMLMAANSPLESDWPAIAEAYWNWRDEIKGTEAFEHGADLPLNSSIAYILMRATPKKFDTMIEQRLGHVRKTDRLIVSIKFAEQAAAWGSPEAANDAMKLAEKQAASATDDNVSDSVPLAVRQALAHGYWTCSMFREALAHFEAILAQLEKDDIAPSTALLATVARVAWQSGELNRGIELEEQSLAVEQKYLPDTINLSAFNKRYGWLWSQYELAVKTAKAKKDDGELDRVSQLARRAWVRWQEVDRDNVNQSVAIANLLKNAGADDEEIWQHLSTAIDRRPRDSASYSAVANWYQSQKDLDKTEQFLEEAYRWDTANPQLLYQRAEVLENLKRGDDAVQVYTQIVNGDWAEGLRGWQEKAKARLGELDELDELDEL